MVDVGIGTLLPLITGRGDPEGSYYTFDDQPGDYMQLQNSNDLLIPVNYKYSVVARISKPGVNDFGNTIICSKWPDDSNYGSWLLKTTYGYGSETRIQFYAQFGTSTYDKQVSCIHRDNDILAAGTCNGNGGGNGGTINTFLIGPNGTHVATNNINYYDPTYDPEPVTICKSQRVAGGGPWPGFSGYVYWVAFFEGVALTQTQLEELFNGSTKPWDLNPTMYIDFHKPVSNTYKTEVGNYTFDVIGTPVRGGLSTFGEINQNVFGITGLHDIPVHPRPTAKDAGIGTIASDQEEKDGGLVTHPWNTGYRAGMSSPAAGRDIPTHPRSTAKDKGIGVTFLTKKKAK